MSRCRGGLRASIRVSTRHARVRAPRKNGSGVFNDIRSCESGPERKPRESVVLKFGARSWAVRTVMGLFTARTARGGSARTFGWSALWDGGCGGSGIHLMCEVALLRPVAGQTTVSRRVRREFVHRGAARRDPPIALGSIASIGRPIPLAVARNASLT